MSINITNTRRFRTFGIIAMVVGIIGIGMGVFSLFYMNLDRECDCESECECDMYVRFLNLDEGDVLYGDVPLDALIFGSENYTVALYANNTLIAFSIPFIWDSTTVTDGWMNLRIEVQDVDSDRIATDTVLIKIEQPIPVPGVTITELTTDFSENNGKGNFTVVLNTQPVGNVAINVSSSDISGAVVDYAIDGVLTLIFTPIDWYIIQTINLTGVNDDIDDGDQIFDIVLDVDTGLTTDTTGYVAIDPTDVTITVIDDDIVGITVTPGVTTFNENYGVGNFAVILDSRPDGNVVIDIMSGDTTEATIDGAIDNMLSITFAPGNWNFSRIVNIIGIDDDIPDGEQVFDVVLVIDAGLTTDTTGYSGIDPADVTVTVIDDDIPGMTVTPGVTTFNENHGNGNFTLVLNSKPDGDVVIDILSGDTTEAIIDGAVDNVLSITFTPGNWNISRTVDIFGVDDGIPDGEQEVYIILLPNSDETTDTTGYTSISPYAFTVHVQQLYTLVNWEGIDAGWVVSPNLRSVLSTNNLGPSIYYSNLPDTIGVITIKMSTTSVDNDYIGCVLGYDPGDINGGAGTDYLTIYWGETGGLHEFLRLYRTVDGSPTLLAEITLGWTQNYNHTWTIDFSTTNLRLWIDSVLYIDTSGTFDTGYFGFYVDSQENSFFQMISP